MNYELRVKNMKQMTRGLLCAAFLTFSPLAPCSLFLAPCMAADNTPQAEFPFEGGTTSDGIEVTEPELDGLQKMENENALQVIDNSEYATMRFSVTVPEGQTASLTYKLLLKLVPIEADGTVEEGSVSFTARLGDVQQKDHRDKKYLDFQADEITIPAGDHEIFFELTFNGVDCNYIGYIGNLCLHIHNFGDVQLSRQPICGVQGVGYARCDVCGKQDSTYTVEPEYSEHSFIELPPKNASCLSNIGTVRTCEHCPYTEIDHSGKPKEHDFDADGKCNLCGLHMPKCNADTTVYDINDASEMLVLAEMVSLGRIPGNIGVNILNDLVFTPDMPMTPLGNGDHPFQGVLNGNGHRVLGIVNTYQGTDCLGFVGVAKGTLLSHAVIANLIFDSGNSMAGEACVGGIVGYAEYCDIVNCASFGSLEGTNYVGGLVGYADKQVSIFNCAAVTTIRTQGTWNTMACGMPSGHIMNSYGACTNVLSGTMDELPTATLRHCFSSMGSAEGLSQVGESMLSSYNMVELLNEQSESTCFMMSDSDPYPIPVVSTTVTAQANRAIRTNRSAYMYGRRAAMLSDDDEELSEKERGEVVIKQGYVDETISLKYKTGRTIDEVMSEDTSLYDQFNRIYVTSRRVPKGYDLYDEISGGKLVDLESYFISADSAYIGIREYDVVSSEKVAVMTETVNEYVGGKEQINEYKIENDGTYTLMSRVIIESENNLIYQENVEGIMKPTWSIRTVYDDEGNAEAIYAYSHDYNTGEKHLEYTCKYTGNGHDDGISKGRYEEYLDSTNNTIHILYNMLDSTGVKVTSREHYILRGSDQYPLEIRLEKMTDGRPYLTDGMYFIYDDEGALRQSVAFAPIDKKLPSMPRPYLYHEYIGFWQPSPYPTAIKVPEVVKKPSLKKRTDTNVYDMQGRIVRQVTDAKDPFSGLPRGIYIYQGTKYLKR